MASQQPQRYAPDTAQQASEVVLATAGYDHTIRFWEALSGICVRTIQFPDSQVNRLAINNSKRYLAVAGNPHLRLYDVQSSNPDPVRSFEGHTGNVTAVAFEAAGRWIVSASEDGTMKIWDARAPDVQRDYELKAPVNDMVIHPNQGELVSCDANGSIKMWDLGENACTHEFIPEEDVAARSVSMSGDGQLLVAANDRGNFYAWRLRRHAGKTAAAEAADESPEVEPLLKVPAHSKYITRCLLSPDARYVATCSADHSIKLWNTADGRFALARTLTGHQRWVWDCAFSADSAYLVSASSDNSARLWDLASGEAIRTYTGHQKAVTSIALHDISL